MNAQAKIQAQQKRKHAIRTLRQTGMTDAEIEAELGHSLNSQNADEIIEAEVIDAEVIEAEIVENLPARIEERKYGPESAATSLQSKGSKKESHRKSGPIEDGRIGKRDWAKYSEPERQCTAHRKDGSRCGNAAILGGNVCRYHGGASKFVKQAARARLDNAADRMARNLLGLAEHAESETVQLGATNSALDRAGIFKPTQVEIGPIKPWEEIFDGISGGPRDLARSQSGYTSSPLDEHERADDSSTGRTRHQDEQDSAHLAAPMDSGPPASTHSDQKPDRDRRHSSDRDSRSTSAHHVTGEAALAVAADLARRRGLPRGRY